MRRVATALLVFAAAAVVAAPAQAKKRHHHKKPAGVEGMVRDATCYGPCAEPAPPEPVYSEDVTITVRRARDGALVASQAISDGKFRMRVPRGTYEVSSVPPNPPPCQPTPETVCPMSTASPAVTMPCLTGETKHVEVRRHRFTHVELHVTNTCIV